MGENKIKICGIKDHEIAKEIIALKPDYLGVVVDFPKSPRSIQINELGKLIIPDFMGWVYLFVNHDLQTISKIASVFMPAVFQLHGKESPDFVREIKSSYDVEVWKAVSLNSTDLIGSLSEINEYSKAGVDKILIDSVSNGSFGGTGIKADWGSIKQIRSEIKTPLILAGGLTVENVSEGISSIRPNVVDVSSGVEEQKGVKNIELVKKFIHNARLAFGASSKNLKKTDKPKL